MPVYEYLCNECGPFKDMRPMSECDDPQACPRCETSAPRVILTAPNFFCMSPDKRKAIAVNERSRVQGLARARLRLLFDQAITVGAEDQKRRQELPDRAPLDDQPLERAPADRNAGSLALPSAAAGG